MSFIYIILFKILFSNFSLTKYPSSFSFSHFVLNSGVSIPFNLKLNLYESVENIKKDTDQFKVKTNIGTYKSDNIVFATGFYDRPFLIGVPGEDLSKVKHYYTEPHPYFGMDIVVVGSANSAVDVALETYRKGAKSVTMIIREKEIGTNVKYWARPDILNRIKEGTIKAHFNAEITLIEKDFIHLDKIIIRGSLSIIFLTLAGMILSIYFI